MTRLVPDAVLVALEVVAARSRDLHDAYRDGSPPDSVYRAWRQALADLETARLERASA